MVDVYALLTGAGLSAGVGIAAKALGFWKDAGISEAQLNERLQTLKVEMLAGAKVFEKSSTDFNEDLRANLSELRAVTLTVAQLQSSQDVTNKFMLKGLDALAQKSDNHDKIISETQVLMGQILAELKHKGRP